MNILHVNTYGSGGAFTGLYRLHKALLQSGLNSRVLVRTKATSIRDEKIIQYNDSFRHENLLNRVGARLGISSTALQRRKKYLRGMEKGNYEVISFPFSNIDITKSKAYDWADIINLHWIGDYLDYETFFSKNRKPVIWTLRDCYPFLGIFHTQLDKERNSDAWNFLDDKMAKFKIKQIDKTKVDLKIIGISQDITKKSQASSILGKFRHKAIYNCLDQESYGNVSKERARKLLNIAPGRIVLSFVAQSLSNFRKGFKDLMLAIEGMDTRNVEFISCGIGSETLLPKVMYYKSFGRLPTENVKLIYSASDAFIFPTKEEPFGNVMIEAMACGTPVIGTPVGSLPEVIVDGFNGILSSGTTSSEIRSAIQKFIETRNSFDSEKIRDFVKERFSPSKIASQYFEIYQGVLK